MNQPNMPTTKKPDNFKAKEETLKKLQSDFLEIIPDAQEILEAHRAVKNAQQKEHENQYFYIDTQMSSTSV